MSASDRARLVIDLDALAHNLNVIRQEAAGAEVAAVVKADGYGLGAGPISRRLWAEGVRRFFVARVTEGEALRPALEGRAAEIHVLDGMPTGTEARFAAADLIPVISTPLQARSALAVASAGGLAVSLQVDTGMNRQGLSLADAQALAAEAERQRLNIRLLISHLGSATTPSDARNADQLARFAEVRRLFPGVTASLAASGGAFLGPAYRHDVVRAGVSLYGGGPEERPDPRLRAVATLSAPILDIRELKAGDRLSYGETFTAARPMRVAIVAAGYADGVIRSAMGRGRVHVAGRLRPLLAVNMDLLIVDLEDGEAAPGDSVELLGPNALLDDLAAAAGTVAHEVLVRLSSRAERVYLGAV